MSKKNCKIKKKSLKRKSKSIYREFNVKKKQADKAESYKCLKKESVCTDKQIFLEKLKEAAKGLIYLSETDSEVLPFIGEKSETVDVKSLLKQIDIASDANISEVDFEEFFENLTKFEDWFDKEETETAEKFLKLKNLLEANLSDLRVFKFGNIEIEIYVVGLDKNNKLLGIKTKAVET